MTLKRPDLVRVVVDTAGISEVIDQVDTHLTHHDAQIEELFRLLKNVPTKDDLEKALAALYSALDKLKHDFNSQLDAMRRELVSANDLDALKQELNRVVKDVASLQAGQAAVKSDISDIHAELAALKAQQQEMKADQTTMKSDLAAVQTGMAEMQTEQAALKADVSAVRSEHEGLKADFASLRSSLEARVSECENQAKNLTGYLQSVAHSFAMLNKTTAALDPNLGRTLMKSASHVNQNFVNIFERLKQLETGAAVVRDRPDFAPPPTIIQSAPTIVQSTPAIDLSPLQLRPAESRSFHDPPTLPPLHKFRDLTEPVDYIYQLLPTLQAILNCFKDRISELDRPFPAEAAIRALLDQISAAVAGLTNELADLRAAMQKALTRADVIRIVKGMLTMEEVADQTAIGVVRCIACGREMRQVAGALTEEDALRMLGEPTTSLVRVPSIGVPFNQMFQSPKSFESVDSPRSTRPARRPRIRKLE
jgi:uncharacterized phage infection (PIP) family protein YhgE